MKKIIALLLALTLVLTWWAAAAKRNIWPVR